MDHSDIVCSMDVECGDRDKPDYEFCMYLAQFINWFVNGTFRDIGLILDQHKKKLFKIQVFNLYSKDKDGFSKLIDNFNRYMENNATTIFPDTSIYDMVLYPDPPNLLQGRQTAEFYTINGKQVYTKNINLVIAAHIIHKILSLPELVMGIIWVSQLQTYMKLLPSKDDPELNAAYLQTLQLNPNDDTIRLLQIPTPLQAEIILHAENSECYKGSRGRHSILEVRYPGLSIEDVRLPILPPPPPPQAPPPPLSFPPPEAGSGWSHERSVAAAAAWTAANRAHADAQAAPPNGGAKKRNKSKRRNQKKSNKKSRRHRNRKRLSIRNAKRFY